MLAHNGRRINIGSDWGVRLGDSAVKPVAWVARWRPGSDSGRQWEVTVETFHD